MRFEVKVHPRSSKDLIVQKTSGLWDVYISASAVDNKANQALVGLLSKTFKISKSRIKIVVGLKSKRKVIEIE